LSDSVLPFDADSTAPEPQLTTDEDPTMLPKLFITLAILSALSLAVFAQEDAAKPKVIWKEATTFDLPRGLTKPDPNVGAMGSSVKGFRIGKQDAAVIVDRLDRKGIVVFMSICDPRARNAGEVRLEFITHDDERHESKPAASVGGWCLSFQAPTGVPSEKLKEFRVLYDTRAAWTK